MRPSPLMIRSHRAAALTDASQSSADFDDVRRKKAQDSEKNMFLCFVFVKPPSAMERCVSFGILLIIFIGLFCRTWACLVRLFLYTV